MNQSSEADSIIWKTLSLAVRNFCSKTKNFLFGLEDQCRMKRFGEVEISGDVSYQKDLQQIWQPNKTYYKNSQ